MVAFGRGRQPAVVQQFRRPAAGYGAGHPVAEFRHPAGRGRVVVKAPELVQVMGGAARRQHQHAFVPQRPDRLAQCQMGGGAALAQDRQLRDGDIRLRVHQRKRDPGAMVQPAPGIAPHSPAQSPPPPAAPPAPPVPARRVLRSASGKARRESPGNHRSSRGRTWSRPWERPFPNGPRRPGSPSACQAVRHSRAGTRPPRPFPAPAWEHRAIRTGLGSGTWANSGDTIRDETAFPELCTRAPRIIIHRSDRWTV